MPHPMCRPSAIRSSVQRYRHHYMAHHNDLSLFDGVLPMLQGLRRRHHWLAVATGKSRRGLDEVLHTVELKGMFDGSRTADETAGKPHPRMLDELMREFGVAPERTLMIGDTTHDLQMALNAGCASLAVSYGAHEPGGFAELKPLAVLHSVCRDAAVAGEPRMRGQTGAHAMTLADDLVPLCNGTDLQGRWSGGTVRHQLRRPDLSGLRHPMAGPGACLPEPLHPRGHGTGLAAGPVFRRFRQLAALRHPWRPLPARHRRLPGRPLSGRAGQDRAGGRTVAWSTGGHNTRSNRLNSEPSGALT